MLLHAGRESGHPRALTRKLYALTWFQALRVLLSRQWLLTLRDSALVRGRIIQVPAPCARCLPLEYVKSLLHISLLPDTAWNVSIRLLLL